MTRWRRRTLRRPSSGNRDDINWAMFCTLVLSSRNAFKELLVFEPTVDWNIPLFQRPQHMAIALGRRGCLIIYRTAGDGVRGFKNIEENVWLANAAELEVLKNAVWCFYSTAHLCSPGDMSIRKRSGRVIFEYIDHIDSAISGSKVQTARLRELKEAAFSGSADYIIASARTLYEEALGVARNAQVAYVPNGVNVDHFRAPSYGNAQLPQQLVQFRKKYKKIVGYFGAIAPWLWYEMISAIAKKRGDIGFVFIGPDYGGCAEKLPRAINVLYLGTVHYSQLPLYARCFDVCFIPFQSGQIAGATSPLKLFEYFALERPVIVTASMRECVAFPEVLSAADVTSFSDAIDRALLLSADVEFRGRLAYLAEQNSWDVRAQKYISIIRPQIEKNSLDRLQ